MKSWILTLAVALLIALSNGHPVPEENSSTGPDSEDKSPSVFEDYVDDVETSAESTGKETRSILSGEPKVPKDPSVMITKALEDVSETLGTSIKNLGNSAIQILEGTGVAAEQALGTGARIVTGVAETAAEVAETGAKSAIRIANGVANSLTHGTRSLVETKTNLLKGLTGASSLQADASSTNEAVQRQERQSYGGYSSSPSYGPNTAAETPNNFVNVFSQAAANTVNFGTQLLNSLVGVAANILQGTVSTLLSLLNAKGQVVGAVVQSAPPVLASVTRTAGDVLAAKARIFGAVTQGLIKLMKETKNNLVTTGTQVGLKIVEIGSRIMRARVKTGQISLGAYKKSIKSIDEAAVSFGSQLARTFGDTFGGLFNRINAIGGTETEGNSNRGLGSILAALSANRGSETGGNRGLGSILSALGGAGGSRDISSTSGGANGLIGGIGNLAQTLINAKLNLLNGLLSPFTGGRSLINLGANRGVSSSSSSSGGYGGGSESNFRISIASTPSSVISIGGDESSSNGPRAVRFFVNPDATSAPPKLEAQLSPANLFTTFQSGVFKGFVDQLNKNLKDSLNRNAERAKFGGFNSSKEKKDEKVSFSNLLQSLSGNGKRV